MSDQGGSEALTAGCTQCGGNVALTLAGPEPTCRFCGNPDPLEASVRSRLQTMRARLAHRAGRQRQLTGQLISSAGSATFGSVAILVTCWLLFGGMAFGFAAFSHDLDFVTFAAGPPPEAELSGEWWLLFALAVGLPLSVGFWALSIFRLRGLKADALPLPPAYPGARPRCRCCGAELPPGTALRRCRYCQADNIVVGSRYRRSELDLDRALDGVAKSFERSLESRLSTAGTTMMVSAFTPMVLMLVAPVAGLIAGVTMPELWPVAAGCAVFAVIALILPATRRLPKIEPLSYVAVDTELSVGGSTQQVNAQLFVPTREGLRRVYSIIGDERRSFELSMYVKPEPGGDPIVVHKLTAGGQPLDASEQDRLEPVELWLPGRSRSEGVRVEQVHLVRHRKSGFRLWQGDRPTPGTAPTWTANRMKDRPIIYFP